MMIERNHEEDIGDRNSRGWFAVGGAVHVLKGTAMTIAIKCVTMALGISGIYAMSLVRGEGLLFIGIMSVIVIRGAYEEVAGCGYG